MAGLALGRREVLLRPVRPGLEREAVTVRLRLFRFGFGAVADAYCDALGEGKGAIRGDVRELELRVHVAWWVVVVRRSVH